MLRIVMRMNQSRSSPGRLTVGDIIRCADFHWGLRWNNDSSGEVMVAWRDRSYPAYHVQAGSGTVAHDPTRGAALFLVLSIGLVEVSGPDDMFPGNHRLSREVRGIRLTSDRQFSRGSERIRFALDEPLSVVRPNEENIEVLGFTELPISWDEAAPVVLVSR
jgi:hypothetical protein